MAEDPVGGLPPRARWAFWLLSGVLAGLLLGFAAGLARPRARAL